MFEAEQVTTSWGGVVEIPFEHSVYWPALIKLCAEQRGAQMERWKQLGSPIGASEWDLRRSSDAPADLNEKVAEQAAAEAETKPEAPVVA